MSKIILLLLKRYKWMKGKITYSVKDLIKDLIRLPSKYF